MAIPCCQLEPPMWSRNERVRADRPYMPQHRTDTALNFRVVDAGEDLLCLCYYSLDTYWDVTNESQSYERDVQLMLDAQWLYHAVRMAAAVQSRRACEGGVVLTIDFTGPTLHCNIGSLMQLRIYPVSTSVSQTLAGTLCTICSLT